MSDSKSIIYFFADSEGQIRINHLNNTADEIAEYYGYHDDYSVLLFGYCFKTRSLYVVNVNDDVLKKMLIDYQKYKSKGSINSDKKEIVEQLDIVFKFLKKHFIWKGEIFSREELQESFSEKNIKDFNLAWNYLNLIFGSMKIDPIEIPIYIIDDLKYRSKFIQPNDLFKIDDREIVGPAILIRRTNSLYFINEAIVYQYILNLHGIVSFYPGLEEEYIEDAKEFVDKTLVSFLRSNNLEQHTFWYVGKKDGNIYLDKNEYMRDSEDLVDDDIYSFVLTFEYIVVEDSRCVIFNNVTGSDINDTKLYKSMFDFVMNNLSHIGHVDENGKELKDPPIILFEGLKTGFKRMMVSNLPIWILIRTVFCPLYDFDPQDIMIIKGVFNEPFSFKFIDPLNIEDKEFVSEYFSVKDFNFPVICWNTVSYDSVLGKWNIFIKEYMKFIGGGKHVPTKTNLKEELKNFEEKVLESKENQFAFEGLVGLLCEDNPHIHQYNIFNMFIKVVGLTGIITEEMLLDNKSLSDEIVELMTVIQTRLFFLTLKSMAVYCNMKHGINYYIDGEIKKGDIVTNEHGSCIAEVKSVLLEPSNIDDDNIDGITYICRDLITNKEYVKLYGDIKLFHLGFLDEEEYNEEKTSSSLKKIKIAQEDKEVYKRILEQYLRNKKRSNPLDYVEEDEEPPALNAYLEKQRKEFD
ncbi:MAG: hypothetical protein ACOCUI_01315, partial [bacterium]